MDHAFAVFIRMEHDATDTERRIIYLLLQCDAQFWRSNKIARKAIFVLPL